MFGLFKKKPKTIPVDMEDEYYDKRGYMTFISHQCMGYVDYKVKIEDPQWFIDAHNDLTNIRDWFQDKVNEYQKRVKLLKHSSSSEDYNYTIAVYKLERYKGSLKYCKTTFSVLEHTHQIWYIRNN